MTRRPTSEEAAATRRDRLERAHQQLTEQVEALTSSERWQKMLDTAARFPAYSWRNCMLILAQRPDPTLVMGFGSRDRTTGWKSLGRYVKPGEHAIWILAPMHRKVEVEDDAGDKTSVQAISGFRPVPVYDVAQTDGEPIPEVRPVLLEGDAPARLWDSVVDQIAHHGYETKLEAPPSAANGDTNPLTNTVRVRPELSPFQKLKTGVHELAHIRLGHPENVPEYRAHRGRSEVEAESVAYVVCSALGYDTSAYSVPYAAGWAGGDTSKLAEVANKVVTVAHAILDDLGLGRSLETAGIGVQL